jgi:hypothetical protein
MNPDTAAHIRHRLTNRNENPVVQDAFVSDAISDMESGGAFVELLLGRGQFRRRAHGRQSNQAEK